MKTRLERNREKHNDLVAQLAKVNERENKYVDRLIKARQQKYKLIRAVTRSSKRLDQLVAAATHTNGPTATVAPTLIAKVAEKEPEALLNDPVPELTSEKPKGKRKRRTADDFKADVKRKQLDTLA